MADITSINQRRTFVRSDAQRLLPVIRRITQEAVSRSETLAVRYEALPKGHPSRSELERELNEIIVNWAAKIQKLGAEAKGLWLVDFEATDRTFGWRYPELDLRELSS